VSEVPLGRLMLRIAGRYARTIQAELHTTGTCSRSATTRCLLMRTNICSSCCATFI
jgi:hypothetical protein